MKISVIFAVAGLGFVFAALAAENKISVGDLPQAVRYALKTHTRGAKIVGASKEQERDGKFTYEVETKQDGKGRDLTFDDEGTLVEVEQQIDLSQVPALAREALQKRAEGGTIAKVESVTKGSETSYEADVKMANGKGREIAVNADGTSRDED
jgi:uncharacterized membrane protein YkoI